MAWPTDWVLGEVISPERLKQWTDAQQVWPGTVDGGAQVLKNLGSLGIGHSDTPTGLAELRQPTNGQPGMRIRMPLAVENTSSALRLHGYSPALEFLDKDSIQNWFIGIDDDDGNKLIFGRGYGPGQGIQASMFLDDTLQVTVGKQQAQSSQGPFQGRFSVIADSDTENDHTVFIVRRGGSENLVRQYHYATSPQPIYSMVASRGTIQTPAALQSGDLIGAYDARGNDGSGTVYFAGSQPGESDSRGSFQFYATQNWAAGAHGAQARIYTTPNGTALQQLRLTIDQDGALIFDTAGPKLVRGSGSPEGVVTAPVGSIFLRTNGGAGTSIYIKEAGSSNTGWVGK